MGHKSYVGGYRGRKTGHDFLKVIVIFLAVVALALVGVTLIGSERLAAQQQSGSPQEGVAEPETSPEIPEPEQTQPEAEPVPEPEPERMAALELPLEEAVSITAAQRLEEAGANSLILDMKPDNGPLGWVSSHPMAAEVNANSTLAGINEMLEALNEQEYYTVARISCFRDELLSVNKAYCIRSNSDYRWQDFEKVNWTSPTVTQVQDYLVALMVELAQLGFDEILLDNCGYPPDGSGEMGWIKRGQAYDLENLDVVVGEFLEKARQALEPYDTTLSIRTKAEFLTQDGFKTGLTAQVLENYAQRIWLASEQEGLSAQELLNQAQVTQIQSRLVEEVSALSEDSQLAQAKFRE